jgi:hypothetical protein
MIDKMFQQEITNAELRKRYAVSFLIHDMLMLCCPAWSKRCCVPPRFTEPEECGGDILQKLMGLDSHIDITDDDIDMIMLNRRASRHKRNAGRHNVPTGVGRNLYGLPKRRKNAKRDTGDDGDNGDAGDDGDNGDNGDEGAGSDNIKINVSPI